MHVHEDERPYGQRVARAGRGGSGVRSCLWILACHRALHVRSLRVYAVTLVGRCAKDVFAFARHCVMVMFTDEDLHVMRAYVTLTNSARAGWGAGRSPRPGVIPRVVGLWIMLYGDAYSRYVLVLTNCVLQPWVTPARGRGRGNEHCSRSPCEIVIDETPRFRQLCDQTGNGQGPLSITWA
jgi:hypothetical protein